MPNAYVIFHEITFLKHINVSNNKLIGGIMTTKSVFLRSIIKSLLLLILLPSSILFAQEEIEAPSKTLELRKVISDSLPPKRTHPYILKLKADQFICGIVNQISVDVVVKIKGPDGQTVQTFDWPQRGPETFHFESKDTGVYRIEVRPYKEQTGCYSIELKNLEAIAKDPQKRVDQLVAPYIDKNGPGAVVAIVKNGKITFSKAYGMANLTHSIPFTIETLNNIGSTSKQFTAFGIALLAKQGKLSLDDDVRIYLPKLKDFGKKISIRNLLTHTSGYREIYNLLPLAGIMLFEGDYIDRAEMIKVVERQPELQSDPGSEFNYNNTGFCLLAAIIEKITGQSFPDWMNVNVFLPLEMTKTTIRANPWQLIPNSAQGYMPDKRRVYREGRDLTASIGAGGIYTTIGDLAKWIRNFKTAMIGGEDIINQMTTRFVLSNGDTSDYGLGLFIDKHRGLNRIHHAGGDIAHRSQLAYYPDIDAAVITQSNYASFPYDIAWKVAELFFDDHMVPKKNNETEAADSISFNPANYDPKKFDEFVGRYELKIMPGFILTFSRENDKFFTQATGQSKAEIVPTSDSTFKLIVVEASITFHRNKENKVESLTLHQNGNHLAKRLQDESWKPSQEELATYTGRYFSEELETFYTLAIKDSNMVVQHRRMDDIKMTPIKKDAFNGLFPIAELIFVRNDEGEIVGLEVSNVRTRGVRFERQR